MWWMIQFVVYGYALLSGYKFLFPEKNEIDYSSINYLDDRIKHHQFFHQYYSKLKTSYKTDVTYHFNETK